MLLFLTNCILISVRFYLRPGSFMHSFTDQVESLFAPAFVSIFFCIRFFKYLGPLIELVCFVCLGTSSKTTLSDHVQYRNNHDNHL